MICLLPGCGNKVTRRDSTGQPASYCCKEHQTEGRKYNFHGNPTGRNSVYRSLNPSQRREFNRWLSSSGRVI